MKYNPPHRPRYRSKRKSNKLTDTLIRLIWASLQAGNLYQHQIAALYGVNQGRVSEIATGKRGNHITKLRPR
jgi:predicted XRE-type DNA-binding protein